MDQQAPVLSICIPSYNRAALVRQTLASIVAQDAFRDSAAIEVIVSDNGSTDDTPAQVAPFVQAYPDRIIYQRHDPGLRPDENFITVLRRGRGDFLKLHNDNLTFRDGSLAEMLRVIEATRAEQPVLFFTNGNQRAGDALEVVNNLSDFVRRASFFTTWSGAFGIWRTDFEAMPDFGRNERLKLIQTDVVLRMVASGKRAVLLFESYFAQIDPGRKSGYNIAQVFGHNYLSLLKPYLATGQLDPAVYAAEKKTVLLKHIIPYYFSNDHDFQRNGFIAHLQDYADEPYFHEAVEQLRAQGFGIDESMPPAPADAAQQPDAYWRARNPHNETHLGRVVGPFDPARCSVGRKSRGPLHVWSSGHADERLEIGHFVSIAGDVTFVLGGDDPCRGFATYPFKAAYFGEPEARAKAGITVGDDVWIGFGATILSGVTVGQGAVIAAGSVVAEDVPPYAIVAGNPAHVIKLRFEQAVIDRMLAFDFSRLTDAAILASRDILDEGLNADNVDAVLARLRT